MNQPITTYSSWIRAIPQILVVAALTVLILNIFPSDEKIPVVFAALSVYFAYVFLARYFIASAQRKGIGALSKGEFEIAIEEFERSFEFFSRNEWVDNYRSIILMASSVWSYREMALMNIAAAYSMKKDVKMYRESNERLLREYPNNKRAKQALEFLDAMTNETS